MLYCHISYYDLTLCYVEYQILTASQSYGTSLNIVGILMKIHVATNNGLPPTNIPSKTKRKEARKFIGVSIIPGLVGQLTSIIDSQLKEKRFGITGSGQNLLSVSDDGVWYPKLSDLRTGNNYLSSGFIGQIKRLQKMRIFETYVVE